MGLFNRNPRRTTAELAAEHASAHRTVTLVKGAGAAVDYDTVATRGGVEMAMKFDKAGASLSKAGLHGIRAEAVMILDHSGSMRSGYRSGMVQTLVDRALGFALQIDRDGRIPVIPFDTRLWPTVEVTLDNYRGVVAQQIFKPNQMGGTLLAPALRVVLDMAKKTTAPIYLLLVTDDDPNDRAEVTPLLEEMRRYPVFIKVLTLVDAPYWDEIDDRQIPGLIDNLDAKRIPHPATMSDLAFTDKMVDEWASWIAAALRAGIVEAE